MRRFDRRDRRGRSALPSGPLTPRHRLALAPAPTSTGAERLDLRPLRLQVAATELVQLGRGELNEVFRRRGLFSPDPMPINDRWDDVAAFERWTADMPLRLVPLLLSLLWRTHDTLGARHHERATALALRTACAFLLCEPAPAERVLEAQVHNQP